MITRSQVSYIIYKKKENCEQSILSNGDTQISYKFIFCKKTKYFSFSRELI